MRSWSWNIGRIAGIPIYIHWTFLVLLAWIAYAGTRGGHTGAQALVEVGFTLALFGCVVLHELGHALMARRFGVPTADITLLPIGGVARLQKVPEKPQEEFLVAIAGPLVNVVIVLLLYLAGVRAQIIQTDEAILLTGGFWGRLMLVNIFLVLFNLLPAFPMDGGRVLRSLLAMTMDYNRATRIAASIGQMMALGFAFLGLQSNPLLLLIALFVWIGAGSEAADVQQKTELRDVPVREAMLTDYQTLVPTDPLSRAAELLLAGSQQEFPVLDDGQIIGVLTRQALLRGLSHGGRDAAVSEYLDRTVGQVEASAMLVPALTQMRETGAMMMQVVEDGRTVGLLTLENIGELLLLRAAVGGQSRPSLVGGPV